MKSEKEIIDYISPKEMAILKLLNEKKSHLEVAKKFNKTEKEIKDIQTASRKKLSRWLKAEVTGKESTLTHISGKIVGYCYAQPDWILNDKEKGEKGMTLQEQRDKLKEHAQLWGYEIVEMFEDVSLKGEITMRPALTRLTKRLEEEYNEIQGVFVCELDILADTVHALSQLEKRFRELNAPLYSIKEPVPITDILVREMEENTKKRERILAYKKAT